MSLFADATILRNFINSIWDKAMLSRRSLLNIGFSSAFILTSSKLLTSASAEDFAPEFAVPDFGADQKGFGFWTSKEPVPEEGYTIPTLDEHEIQVRNLTGAGNPYPSEIKLGKKLLAADIPVGGVTPYEVAYRFFLWRKGLVGSTQRQRDIYSAYSREWPERGNPIIMKFFTEATGLRNPKGDTTYWCSAFVSWCIMRARSLADDPSPVWPKEHGAASASYRTWGTETSTPRTGDIAVFKRTDRSWAGHVGFVHKVEGNTIFLLGGNQGAQNDYNGGEVNIAKYRNPGGGKLRFHSFRTSSHLRDRVFPS